jgi:8-oxo-dGTP diphosphatase
MRERKSRQPTRVVAAVVERDGRYLLTRRLVGTHLGGYWEFPGGKCREEEDLEACLRREIREELDVEIEVGPKILSASHSYPDRVVELHFYACAFQGPARAVLGQEMLWARREDLADLRVPPADRELVEKLTKG